MPFFGAFFIAAPPESLPTGRAPVPRADSRREPSPGSAGRRRPQRERGTGGAQHPGTPCELPLRGIKHPCSSWPPPCPARSAGPAAAAPTAGLAGDSRAVRARHRLAGNKVERDELTGSLGRVDGGCLLASRVQPANLQEPGSFQASSRTGVTKRPKKSLNKCPESKSIGISQIITKFRKSPDLEMRWRWKSSHIFVCFCS